MSLSRPASFPLLKLPFLCIKCVLQNSDVFDIIYFASISNRTRRIVKSSNYPLKEIDVVPNKYRKIYMENRGHWGFIHHEHANGVVLVLQRNSEPFRTSSKFDSDTGHLLYSYTAGDTLDALKIGISFMVDVFGCKIRNIPVVGNNISELFGLGISSAKELQIKAEEPVNITDLKYLFETIKVTDEYVFFVPIPKDFQCDPQVFKCRKMCFGCETSADWVTLEVLCQLDVAELIFFRSRLSKEDIVLYITHWFNSENRKLEYLTVGFRGPITLEDFKIDHLNPMPFCEKRRNRSPLAEEWKQVDISGGMDILRQDGLLATFFIDSKSVFFYVWHKRFPDAV